MPVPVPKITPDQHTFPAGLSQPALRALFTAGYTRLAQLTKVTEKELAGLHGMGPKGIRILKEALQAQGKSFAKPKQ
jgi:predicted flap endonuclease-1-like 5' DNA nuclease